MPKWSFGVCFLLAAPTVLAQTAVNPAAGSKPTAPAAATPGNAAAPGNPVGPQPEPTLPQITDDMLAPVPPATHVLQDWRDALRVLRENSTTLRSLRAQEDIARAQARQALAPALPSLTANAGVTRHLIRGERANTVITQNPPTVSFPVGAVPNPATLWQAALNLRIPLLALSAWHERGTALERIEVAKLDTKAQERFSIVVLADAVVTAVTAERLAEVSRISLESALSTLDLSKRRAALGAASNIDVLRIEQEVSLSRSQVVTTNDAVLRAREALGAALGTAEPYGVAPTIRLDALADDAKSTCRPADVLSRSDVRAAQASVDVSKRNETGVSKTYFPTVDAVSSLTYWSPVSGLNNEHVTWTIGGVLNWTLYDGGLRYGIREQRTAETRVFNAQLTEAKRRAQLEVTQAFRAVRSSEATLAVAARTREISAETARLTKISYLNGSGTSFDLVDSARRQREAEVDYTIKEFGVLRARIAALLALATCDV